MIKYLFKRISCSLLAVILAFSIVGLILSTLFVGCFSSEKYVAKRLDDNKAVIIQAINDEVKPLAKLTGLEETAYVNAINETNFYVISNKVAKNLRYCYNTDFSEDNELYSIYYNSISSKAKLNNKKLKSSDIAKYASLAVYTASRVINTNDTAVIPIFRAIRGKTFVYIVVGTIFFTIASFVGIELINKGRHRKFSYMGMAITSAGYISVFGTLLINKMHYVEQNQFLEFEPYNTVIQNAVNDVVGMMIPFGVVLMITGFVMLAFNYNYFLKKNKKAEEEKEFSRKLVTDFLEYDEPNVGHRLSNGEGFEKEITKIDFD